MYTANQLARTLRANFSRRGSFWTAACISICSTQSVIASRHYSRSGSPAVPNKVQMMYPQEQRCTKRSCRPCGEACPRNLAAWSCTLRFSLKTRWSRSSFHSWPCRPYSSAPVISLRHEHWTGRPQLNHGHRLDHHPCAFDHGRLLQPLLNGLLLRPLPISKPK